MISGGGTGGHIYPAISIAQALQSMLKETEILFVGAKGKMEMQKVPEAGFKIIGLWISGLQRRLTLSNLLFPVKVIFSLIKSYFLIKRYRPDAVVGVGGYASGPLLFVANKAGVPTLIQEQNSYAGLTNKWLSKNANKICVAYPEMDRYFPAGKIVVTGNPVRDGLVLAQNAKTEAYQFFGFSQEKKTLLILGGSLGARTINESVLKDVSKLMEAGVQVIWQTGAFYFDEMKERLGEIPTDLRVMPFLKEMQFGYGIADVVISRAGALSIAELMETGKPSVLVPSPNVAEDHQTKNAMALVKREAAWIVSDRDSKDQLILKALELLKDSGAQQVLSKNIKGMAFKDASKNIAKEVIALIK